MLWITTFAAWRVNEYLGLKGRILKDLANVIRLYEDLGKPEQAEQMRQRAAQIRSGLKE